MRAPDRQDGRAIFARDRERTRAPVFDAHPVDQRRPAEPKRRRAGIVHRDERRLDVEHAGAIGDDAGVPRESARQHARVPRRGLGDRVVLVALRENGAMAVEPAESASELRQEALEVVGAHLVDGQEHDQSGRRRGLGLRDSGERERQRAECQ